MPATEHTAKMGHTILPWTHDEGSGPHCDIRSKNGRAVAVTWGVCGSQPKSERAHLMRQQEDRANAAFIVEAVNAHESLLAQVRVLREALEKAERCLTELYPSRVFTGAHEEEYYAVNRVLNVARAALAQCEPQHTPGHQ